MSDFPYWLNNAVSYFGDVCRDPKSLFEHRADARWELYLAIQRYADESRKLIEDQPDTFNKPRDVPEDLPIG